MLCYLKEMYNFKLLLLEEFSSFERCLNYDFLILIFASCSLLLQIIYFVLSQVGWSQHASLVYHVTDVPVPSIVILVLWPIVALAICELFKRRYIK